MDEDFDDPELWAAADQAASAPAPTRPPAAQPQRIQQPVPQRIDKVAPRDVPSASLKVVQPTPQVLPKKGSGSSILVSPRQKGNPVLSCIKSTSWEFSSELAADYGLGLSTCALFLSLKYHRLYPEYIYTRIRGLQGKYNLRILLAMVDIANHEDPLRELAKTSLINSVTLILCWSAAEAARYLELYKAYEHAGFKAIQGQQGSSYVERLVEFVTVPRGVNKTDAVSLVSNFGSLKNAINADPEQIGIIGGWGEVKVKRWLNAVEEPFRVKTAARRTIPEMAPPSNIDPRLATKSNPPGPLTGSHAVPASSMDIRLAMKSNPGPLIDPGEHGHAQASRIAEERSTSGLFVGDDDEEDAMLAAAIEESKRTTQPGHTGAESSQKARDPEALTDGVAAALARLREQG